MLGISTRRLSTVLAAAALATVATLVAAPPPAHAAASGYLLMKGTGTLYTANGVVNQGGIPGGDERSFSFKIVNTGAASQQFKVTAANSVPGVTASFLLGSASYASPYFTPHIAPGKSLVLTVRMHLNDGVAQGEYPAVVTLRDPETNTALDAATADVNATYQVGNTNHDLFLKTGTQPFVGGSYGTQFETANALKVGATATFVLRLQNNSGAPGDIGLVDVPNLACAASFTLVVKQGAANVTAAVLAGSYRTGVLGPGAKKELKVTIKQVAASACTGVYYGFTAFDQGGATVSQYAHVVTAA